METVGTEQWELKPRKLSNEEIDQPEKVLEEFYDYARLPQARAFLWESFRTMVTGGYSHLKTRDRSRLAYFYEQVEKLVEATHILYSRNNFN